MFLTLEDPRGRVKGSRDPLGVQPIWSFFGRRVVGNLTTQTDSCRGFAVLLLGRYLTKQLLEEEKIQEEEAIDAFLRFEQICGYARHFASDPDDPGNATERILGIERISQRANRSEVTIAATADAAILSDQRAYGLWGLYSAAARASRLLADGPVGVTDEAASFVEDHYLRCLSDRTVREVKKLIREGGELKLKPRGKVVKDLVRALGGRLKHVERAFFRKHLCEARRSDSATASDSRGDVNSLHPGLQADFCCLLERHANLRGSTDRKELVAIRRHAEGRNPELAKRIGHILALEALLAPCDVIFGLLRARHGHTPEAVATDLRKAWGAQGPPHVDSAGFEEVLPLTSDAAGGKIAGHMRAVQQALCQGDYERAIREMLPWNEVVMKNRGAAPWIRLDHHGALDVRYRGPEQTLPNQEKLDSLWRYSYFIDALKALLAQTDEPTSRSSRSSRSSRRDDARAPGEPR